MRPVARLLQRDNLLAFAAGGLCVLAFSPFDLFWLPPLCLALLFWQWQQVTPRQAAWRGYFFALGLLGIGTFWLHISIDQFGGVPRPVAIMLAILFAMFMSLFYALKGWLASRIADYTRAGPVISLLLVFPSVWVLAEMGRGYFLTGFPWLVIGYSQTDTVLGALAPLTGVYGISAAVAVLAGAILLLLTGPAKRLAIAIIVVIFAFTGLLSRVDWTDAQERQIEARLVQGNIPQHMKWQPEVFDLTLKTYQRLSLQQPADLVIWPETAVPAFYQRVEDILIAPLQQRFMSLGSTLVTGIPVYAGDWGYYNSMLSLGESLHFYHKRHLVPFGEYAPFGALLRPLVDYFRIPLSDFRRGDAERPLLAVDDHFAGVSICYEDAFGNESIQALPDAAYLINVSNDAWFGDSLAPHQHLQIARMRAMESRRYMLRATNTGISAFIDHHGRLLQQTNWGETAVLHGWVPLRSGMTPYAYVSDWLMLFLTVGTLLMILIARHPAGLHRLTREKHRQ